MALKKGAQTAENGAGQSSKEMVNNNTPATENGAYDGYQQFIYIGPSLPHGALKENAVLEGSFAEILHFLSEQLERWPQIKKLIVPVNRLAEYSAKVKNGGNIIAKYYADVASAVQTDKEG